MGNDDIISSILDESTDSDLDTVEPDWSNKMDNRPKPVLLADKPKSDVSDESDNIDEYDESEHEIEEQEGNEDIDEDYERVSKIPERVSVGESNMAKEDKGTGNELDESGIDPLEDFKNKLKDSGVKKGTDAIADGFFNGNIDDPEWLNYVMTQAGASQAHRKLMIMSYYGQPAEAMGVNVSNPAGAKYLNSYQNKREEDKSSDYTDVADEEIKKMRMGQLESAKQELAINKMKMENKLLEKQMNGIKDTDGEKSAQSRTIQRPLFGQDGKMLTDGNGRVVTEKVIEPISSGSSQMDPLMMMTSMMQMMEVNKPQQPNAEITQMKEMFSQLMLQNQETKYQNELDRLRSEKESVERMYSDKLNTYERETTRTLDEIKSTHLRELDELKTRFDEKLETRDIMGQMAGNYQSKIDEMEKMLTGQQQSIKDTVVKQASNTTTRVTDQVGAVIEGLAEPVAEMMKQQYTANMEIYRKSHGLDGTVPETTEADMQQFIDSAEDVGEE